MAAFAHHVDFRALFVLTAGYCTHVCREILGARALPGLNISLVLASEGTACVARPSVDGSMSVLLLRLNPLDMAHDLARVRHITGVEPLALAAHWAAVVLHQHQLWDRRFFGVEAISEKLSDTFRHRLQ